MTARQPVPCLTASLGAILLLHGPEQFSAFKTPFLAHRFLASSRGSTDLFFAALFYIFENCFPLVFS